MPTMPETTLHPSGFPGSPGSPESRGPLSVRSVGQAELPAFYAMLARAFEDDPVSEYLFPAACSRLRRLDAFYRAMMGSMAAHGRMDTTERLEGGAIWQAPNPPRPDALYVISMMLRSALQLRGRVRAGLELGRRLEVVHEHRPHWYLAMLGTEPRCQGMGVGSALISSVLSRCDEAGELAYLESSKEVNLRFYQRHGFEVQQEVQIPDGPVMWAMLREPQPSAAVG